MLLAQSIELPPPRPTSESTPAARATPAPASAIAEVGSWSKAENVVTATPTASSEACARAVKPVATTPGSETTSVRPKPSSRAISPSRESVPGPNTRRVRLSSSKGVTARSAPRPPRTATRAGCGS